MDAINTVTLITHIVSGYLALVVGTFVIVARKGNRTHRKAGKVFYFSMIASGSTAVYLSLTNDLIFLLHVAVFVLFQTFAGFRSVRFKQLRPALFDLIILSIAAFNGALMLISLKPVLMVFGGITALLVALDIRIYRVIARKLELPRLTWLGRHIGMMVGSYIGSLTAFLVVNVHFDGPRWIIWLLPTIIFVPIMQLWTWKYTRKGTKKLSTL